MEATNETYTPFDTWGDVLNALRSNDEERIADAIDACVYLGPQAAKFLVIELARTKNQPAFRLRVANALERIAPTVDPRDMLKLTIVFQRDKNAAVREAAGRVIAARRAGQPGAMSAQEMTSFFAQVREVFQTAQGVPEPSSPATLEVRRRRPGRRRRYSDYPTSPDDELYGLVEE